MAKSRLISRDLAESERFWDCSEDARVAYCLGIPYTDRDGCLPRRPRKLLAMFLGMSGWSSEHIAELVDELIAVGLWVDGPTPDSVQVSKFHRHQHGIAPGSGRYEREPASIYAEVHRTEGDTPTGVQVACSDTPTGVQSHAVKRREEKRSTREAEAEAKGPPASNGGGGYRNPATVESRANRLVAAWRAAHHRLNEKAKGTDTPQILPGGASLFDAQQIAKDLGDTLDVFPDGDLLVDGTLTHEVARLIAVFEDKGLVRSFKGVCKHIGGVFDDAGALRSPVIYQKGA